MDQELTRNRGGFRLRAGPSGLHLFDRDTGWNVLVDEVRLPRKHWARAPRQVSIALTNACDLCCPYCYAPKAFGSLDSDRLVSWLQELDNNGCLGVGFGGGEPTLYRNFVEICRQAAELTGLAVTCTTHSHRMTPSYRDQLKGNVHFIRVSMDGIAGTYEEYRGKPFAELEAHISIVRQIAPFGINFVVNARTLRDLDAALELAEGWGASEFLLLPERPARGRPGIDQEALSALRMWIDEYEGRMPIAISAEHADGLFCGTFSEDDGLRAYAHIDANGVLKRSSNDTDGVLIGPAGVMEALARLENAVGDRKKL